MLVRKKLPGNAIDLYQSTVNQKLLDANSLGLKLDVRILQREWESTAPSLLAVMLGGLLLSHAA